MRRPIAACLAGVLLGLAATAAHAQTYPTKPIRVIIGFPPGGAGEILVRTVGQKLTERWGQLVLVDNKPGASGNIAAGELVRSAPDGYTLLYMPAALAVNPSLFPKLPYDLARDFTPVTLFASFPLILVVHPAVPVRSVEELIALARAKPGSLNFASIGNASPPHLAGELFKLMAKVDITHVPYKGAGPAQTDLVAGQVQLMFDTAVSAMPNVKSGRTRALAVTTKRRSPLLPDLPTIAESGLPDYDLDGWGGLVGPAGIPPEIADKLQSEIAAILGLPDVRERLASLGADPSGMAPADFRRFIASEAVKWRRIVVESGAKID
jgi:tripartite-type tricarboxylate transporter receptor subunit TctC